MKWKQVWADWKSGLCQDLTIERQKLQIKPLKPDAQVQQQANYYFFDNLLHPPRTPTLFDLDQDSLPSLPPVKGIASKSPVRHVGIFLNLVQYSIGYESFKTLIEMIRPLGFNYIHLRLADDYGQVVDYESLPGTTYSSFQRHDTSRHNYRRRHLEQLSELAKQSGIEIVPEINLATNGGGWHKAGILLDCPKILCEQKEGVALDTINKQDGVLPIVLAAIQEIREIFSCTSLLHLGSDERQNVAKGCFAEAGYTPTQAHDSLATFETKLAAGLCMIGISQDHIVRWVNEENVRYPNRTGRITQFRNEGEVAAFSSMSSYFGTVHLGGEISLSNTFSDVRRWLGKPVIPYGLTAESSDGGIPSFSRMVAFAIAASDAEKIDNDYAQFHKRFENICADLDCASKDSIIARLNTASAGKTISSSEACNERTMNVTVYMPRMFF
jgi:hypothetical protein